MQIIYKKTIKEIIKDELSKVSKLAIDIKPLHSEAEIRKLKLKLAAVMVDLERKDYLYPMTAEEFEVKIQWVLNGCEYIIFPANNRTREFFKALEE